MQVIQTSKGPGDGVLNQQYTAEQEKVVRDLIAQLKFHLSKFNEEQKELEIEKDEPLVPKCDPKCFTGEN